MYVQIDLFFGGKTLAHVVSWGNEVYDEDEIWGWPKKRLPTVVSVDGRLHQRGFGGYYYPI